MMVGADDGDRVLGEKIDEFRNLKCRVAHLDDMAKTDTVLLLGQERQKCAEILRVEFFVGANCQRMGPRWDPSSVSPCVRNFVIDSPASARTLRLVTKRLAFSEKTKSSGTSEAHLAKVSGFWLL